MSDLKEFKKFAVGNGFSSSLAVENYVSDIEDMTRSVIEERTTNFREVDVFSRMMMDRIMFIGSEIDDHLANIIIAQLLFLDSVDSKKDILLYINSPGGSVYAGLGIYDTMQYVSPAISTVCIGLAASMAAVLLAGGDKGKRSALPHSRIMIHQPLGGAKGQVSDMEITLQQIREVKRDLYDILSRHTGQSVEFIEKHADRDYWMRPQQAKTYGIIDHVLDGKKLNDR